MTYNTSETQFIFLTLILVLLVIFLPDISFAQEASGAGTSSGADTPSKVDSANGTSTKVDETVCNIIEILQGNIARAVAAFGIIFLGFSLFLGKISWGTALALGIGIGAIFGASDIVKLIGDGTAACAEPDATTD